MVRHLRGSFWNHSWLCRPHHRYSHTGGILPRRSQDVVRCRALFHYFAIIIFFSIIIYKQYDIDESRCGWWTICIFGCSPFFPAFVKLRTLFVHLKKLPNLLRGNQIEPTDINENPLTDLDDLLDLSAFAVLAEAAFESAPQFIIQLYAMVVQQESVTIVQMVSLPVSFLSLASASTVADKLLHPHRRHLNLRVKDKVLLFVTHLFFFKQSTFCSCLLYRKLQVVGYKCFDPSLYGDDDM